MDHLPFENCHPNILIKNKENLRNIKLLIKDTHTILCPMDLGTKRTELCRKF